MKEMQSNTFSPQCKLSEQPPSNFSFKNNNKKPKAFYTPVNSLRPTSRRIDFLAVGKLLLCLKIRSLGLRKQ